jgi:HTH-type transcriptional regulator / antitoxin HigA
MEIYMTDRKPAEVFPPGEFIKEELEARGWNQMDLAEIIGRHPNQVNKLVQGSQAVTPETAKALANAFGTSAQLWLNLETAYQLSRIKVSDETISRRAKLYEAYPVRDMIKRHWIEGSENIDILEQRFLTFFGIKSLDEKPDFSHAARKSTSYAEITYAQWAWLCRARQLALAAPSENFSDKAFAKALNELRSLLTNPEDVRQVARILANAGIRLLIIEPLPNTKIDGVCFWLNESSPVVALSIRFDRIDWFWHTLMHELDHVKNREGMEAPIIDTELIGENVTAFDEKPEIEKRADEFACDFLVGKNELNKFIARVKPLYSRQRIELFARRIKVHPGIIVGQLQFRKEFSYKHNREMLVKVRNIITSSALTDGYGNAPII